MCLVVCPSGARTSCGIEVDVFDPDAILGDHPAPAADGRLDPVLRHRRETDEESVCLLGQRDEGVLVGRGRLDGSTLSGARISRSISIRPKT